MIHITIIAIVLIILLYLIIIADVFKCRNSKNNLKSIVFGVIYTLICIRGVIGLFMMVK